MNNELALLAKTDIPFAEAQLVVHQPTIKEISLIGEERFLTGSRFLNFSKNNLNAEDKSRLEDIDDFEIFMSMMNSPGNEKMREAALLVLTLLFPGYEVVPAEKELILTSSSGMARINFTNFDAFKSILVDIFCMKSTNAEGEDYNPSDAFASKIAEKLKKGREKVAEKKGLNRTENQKVAIYSRYVSILAIGLQKDMNQLIEYSVYQLNDEFKRFQLKQSFDINLQARLAGATNLEEVENWMDDIH